MKKTVDYSKIRGFNYSPRIKPGSDRNFFNGWLNYDHDQVDRDMGYAERLRLNSARVFLAYPSYVQDKELFLANLKDFVRTAWKHGVSTNPILFMGFRFLEEDWKGGFMFQGEAGLRPLAKSIEDPSCWYLGEKYADDVIAALKDEEGLLWWDIANEPGYTDNFVTWYDEEPEYMHDYQAPPDLAVLKERQEKTWEIVRHFCRYVKHADPDHDIGVGNIYIYETEPSGTAPLVDVICFHDYFPTRKRMREMLDMAVELGKKYNKPLVNNEMCCIGRANPYDMSIQLHDEYGIGFYLFELMIGEGMWSRVHGVFYDDGTVRDPSIVAAIMGCFRNRTETAIRSDVNQEDYVKRALILGQRVTDAVRNSKRLFNPNVGVEDVLEVAEYAANLLEGGELVPMAYPPTAKIASMRRRTDVDVQEALDYMMELLDTLKKSCHVIESE